MVFNYSKQQWMEDSNFWIVSCLEIDNTEAVGQGENYIDTACIGL